MAVDTMITVAPSIPCRPEGYCVGVALEHFYPDWNRRGLCHCEERSGPRACPGEAISRVTSRWPFTRREIASSLRSSQ